MFRLAAQRAIASRLSGSPRGIPMNMLVTITLSDLFTQSCSEGVSLPHPVLDYVMEAVLPPASFIRSNR